MSEHGPDGTLVVMDETLDHLFNDLQQSIHSTYSTDEWYSAPLLAKGTIHISLMQEEDLIEFDDGPRGVFVDDNVGPVEEFCRTGPTSATHSSDDLSSRATHEAHLQPEPWASTHVSN